MKFAKTISLAITGASGAAYAVRLMECLVKADLRLYVMVSQPGQIVLGMETDLHLPGRPAEIQRKLMERYRAKQGQLRVFGNDQWSAPVASGTGVTDAMVICPCTTGTLASVANGISRSLLERAADVIIKEQKKLILVVRETPLSVIHLEHMLKLAQMGVVILPANPGFYNKPESVTDLVDFIVARILDHLDVEHALVPIWGSESPSGDVC